MIKKLITLFILLMALTQTYKICWATDIYHNFKEGESRYVSNIDKKLLLKLEERFSSSKLTEAVAFSLDKDDSADGCELDIVGKLRSKVGKKYLRRTLKYARLKNMIDDTTYRLLKNASKARKVKVFKIALADLHIDRVEIKEQIFGAYRVWKRDNKRQCAIDGWLALSGKIRSNVIKYKNYDLRRYNNLALHAGILSEEEFYKVEFARKNKFHKVELTLKSYQQKLEQMQRFYPDYNFSIGSSFIAKKIKKQKLSRRERLYRNYSSYQIIMLSNLLDSFRRRLASPLVQIVVHNKDVDGEDEEIDLTPMEQYRFAIKMIRKEMDDLQNSKIFRKQNIQYMDLVAAAYETNLVSSQELEYISEIEEIWNPKKTTWEKVSSISSLIGGIVSIVLPPPWSFIPIIAVIVIEVIASSKKDDKQEVEKEFSLF